MSKTRAALIGFCIGGALFFLMRTYESARALGWI